MNELQLPYKVKHYLDLGAEAVDLNTADKLFAARQEAVARMPPHASRLARLGWVGFGRLSLGGLWPAVRSAVALVMLAAGVAGTSYWDAQAQATETLDVDTALLTDELPINAYLDRGFDEWLKGASPQ